MYKLKPEALASLRLPTEAGPTNTSLFVSDFVHLVPMGSLLLLADLFLSLLHLVCLPADHGGLWRVWPCPRVKTGPGGSPGKGMERSHPGLNEPMSLMSWEFIGPCSFFLSVFCVCSGCLFH